MTAGTYSLASSQGRSFKARVIRQATNTSAGAVAKPGMAVASGAKNSARMNRTCDGEGSEAGAAAGLDTGGAFDVTGCGAGAEDGAEHYSAAVGHQCLFQAGHGAVRAHQAGSMGGGDQGAGIVEDIHQEEGEHNRRDAEVDGVGDIELQERGGERGRSSDQAVESGEAEGDSEGGGDQDADQDGSWNAPCREAGNEQEADAGEKGGSGAEIAEGDESGRVTGYDSHVVKADQA